MERRDTIIITTIRRITIIIAQISQEINAVMWASFR